MYPSLIPTGTMNLDLVPSRVKWGVHYCCMNHCSSDMTVKLILWTQEYTLNIILVHVTILKHLMSAFWILAVSPIPSCHQSSPSIMSVLLMSMTMSFGSFGENLSVRTPPGVKPALMIFGQDNSVYCSSQQILLGNCQWVGPTDGLRSLMMSAFQARETGCGVQISSRVQLEDINEACRGETYVDVDAAAVAIHGQASKNDLKQTPFVVHFELGTNNEGGYWTYNHLTIQLKDCVDSVFLSSLSSLTLPSSCSITPNVMQRNWQTGWMPIV